MTRDAGKLEGSVLGGAGGGPFRLRGELTGHGVVLRAEGGPPGSLWSGTAWSAAVAEGQLTGGTVLQGAEGGREDPGATAPGPGQGVVGTWSARAIAQPVALRPGFASHDLRWTGGAVRSGEESSFLVFQQFTVSSGAWYFELAGDAPQGDEGALRAGDRVMIKPGSRYEGLSGGAHATMRQTLSKDDSVNLTFDNGCSLACRFQDLVLVGSSLSVGFVDPAAEGGPHVIDQKHERARDLHGLALKKFAQDLGVEDEDDQDSLFEAVERRELSVRHRHGAAGVSSTLSRGDVLGCLLDADTGAASFWVNGKPVSLDKEGPEHRPAQGLCPEVFLSKGAGVSLNWGQQRFQYPCGDALPMCMALALGGGPAAQTWSVALPEGQDAWQVKLEPRLSAVNNGRGLFHGEHVVELQRDPSGGWIRHQLGWSPLAHEGHHGLVCVEQSWYAEACDTVVVEYKGDAGYNKERDGANPPEMSAASAQHRASSSSGAAARPALAAGAAARGGPSNWRVDLATPPEISPELAALLAEDPALPSSAPALAGAAAARGPGGSLRAGAPRPSGAQRPGERQARLGAGGPAGPGGAGSADEDDEYRQAFFSYACTRGKLQKTITLTGKYRCPMLVTRLVYSPATGELRDQGGHGGKLPVDSRAQLLARLAALCDRVGVPIEGLPAAGAAAAADAGPGRAESSGVRAQLDVWHCLTVAVDLPRSLTVWLDGERALALRGGAELRMDGPFSLDCRSGLRLFGVRGSPGRQKEWMVGGGVRELRVDSSALTAEEVLAIHQPRGVWLCRRSPCERTGRVTRNPPGQRKCWKCGAVRLKSGTRLPGDLDPKHPGVTVLVNDNFQELVVKSSRHVFVYLTADWCGPSVQLKPHVYEVARHLKDVPDVLVCIMDTDENEKDQAYFPENFIPVIKLFVSGQKDSPIIFDGERSANGFLNFILQHTGVSVMQAVAEKYVDYKREHGIEEETAEIASAAREFLSKEAEWPARAVFQVAVQFLYDRDGFRRHLARRSTLPDAPAPAHGVDVESVLREAVDRALGTAQPAHHVPALIEQLLQLAGPVPEDLGRPALRQPGHELMEAGAARRSWHFVEEAILQRPKDMAERLQKLLDRGFPVDAKPQGYSAVWLAAVCCNLEVIDMLFERSANLHSRGGQNQLLPVEAAACTGHAVVVKRLLELGAYPGRAAHFAARHGEMATIKRGFGGLVELARDARGAFSCLDIGAKGCLCCGWTPLSIATLHAHVPVARLLIEVSRDDDIAAALPPNVCRRTGLAE
ncbi:unnamed protein product, partial [Prorocentrum cordatum]